MYIWGLVLVLLLSPIVWYDHKHQIIPNALSLALAVVGLGFQVSNHPQNVISILLQATIIFIFFATFRSLYSFIRKRQGLGFGDVKLLGAATLWIGALAVPQLMLIATTTGLLYIITRVHFGKTTTKITKIAFGPHICLGLIVTWWINEFLNVL